MRTGLGDYAYAKEGLPTNAELVKRMVKLASAFGRELASPEETRQIKGLKQLSEKNSVLVG
ncbi:MAG: 3-keto-5-aminohexanoate cleavage protein [Actinomycetota bacterium]|nr:3-keto-5-aminohexanoate cleavage protein [Actinomycetota bacterium]